MRKIIAAFLGILLLVSGVGYVNGAALTLTSEEQHVTGNLVVITGTAAVNSGDTLAVRLSTILFVGMSNRNTAASPTTGEFGHRVSGSTITFNTSVEGQTVEFYIVGY